jgi:predicted ATPase
VARRKRHARETAPGDPIAPMMQYLRTLTLLRDKVPSFAEYPYSIPALRAFESLEFHPRVTFFVGENGMGKSTFIEAIAVLAGFNAEGGSRNFNFATRRSESPLHGCLRLARGVTRPADGFFLRAESYFNVGTEIERLDKEGGGGPPIIGAYGNVYVHDQSHGESFMRLVENRFRGGGVYVLDEPEAALSPKRQLDFLRVLHDLVTRRRSQFVIATHSPIIMAYPDAKLFLLAAAGVRAVAYEDTEHYKVTREFMQSPRDSLRALLEGAADPEDAP